MSPMSINIAQQFAADRRAQFEGVATRRRLRRLVRRNAADAATQNVMRRAPELVLTSHDLTSHDLTSHDLTSHQDSASKATSQKVA